jgi:ribosome biogenesis GTPase
MHSLPGDYADLDDLDVDASLEAETYAEYEQDADHYRSGSLSRLASAAGKARPRKNRHGRFVNPNSPPAHAPMGSADAPGGSSPDGEPSRELTHANTGMGMGMGMVCRKSLGRYQVNAGGRMLECAISSVLRKQLVYPIADPTSLHHRVIAVKDIKQVDPVAIGDMVRFVDGGNSEGLITAVLPRRNKLARRAAGPKPLEQVIVANLDQMIAILAIAHPEPKWELLDRYLAAAEWLSVPAVICLTKHDLGVSAELLAEVAEFRAIGYTVLITSTVDGNGIEQFKEALSDRISVLVGPSGVGKTSLLNAIQPGLGLRVGEVSRSTNKGKHTTTNLELFPLDGGGGLVDTPGMREFGLWDLPDAALAGVFREMQPLAGHCRFGPACSHRHEPGCAIKAAVASGTIHERRYQSYVRLRA